MAAVSSLPAKYGVGDFGKGAYRFLDLIAIAGFELWQILPLNPLGYGHSPYQPYSSFAIEELYCDLEDLKKKGFIASELVKFEPDTEKVHYEEARAHRFPYLQEAYAAQMKKEPHCLDKFIEENPWIKDFSVYMMEKRRHPTSWSEWDKPMRDYPIKRPALKAADKKAAEFEIWLQMTLYRQWDALHQYANKKGIQIIGDIPFYVGYDSCDVWANRDEFLLDEVTLEPTFIAGVPPDYFSETGQRWGNPIYDWEKLEKEGFGFIIDRIVRNAKLYDIIRIDHFRAFDTYWKIPSSCPTAVEGDWIEAPGYALFDTLFTDYPDLKARIIAEDLGDLRPEVLALRDHYDFPGMNVIEFTFSMYEIDHKGQWDNINAVAYLGTHDNDTMLSYFYEMEEKEQAMWVDILNGFGYNEGTIVERMIRYCLGKKAKYAILSIQDILGLDADARTNVPGIVDDRNWTWKMADFDELTARLPKMTRDIEASRR